MSGPGRAARGALRPLAGHSPAPPRPASPAAPTASAPGAGPWLKSIRSHLLTGALTCPAAARGTHAGARSTETGNPSRGEKASRTGPPSRAQRGERKSPKALATWDTGLQWPLKINKETWGILEGKAEDTEPSRELWKSKSSRVPRGTNTARFKSHAACAARGACSEETVARGGLRRG